MKYLFAALALLVATPIPVRAQLGDSGAQTLAQSAVALVDEAGDHFGESLAAGDFHGDGYQDLAIGISDQNVGPGTDAGAVHVVFGHRRGLGTGPRAPQHLHRNTSGAPGASETSDRFGSAVASGDLDSDGFDDLLVGVPLEDVEFVGRAGDQTTQIPARGSTGLLQQAPKLHASVRSPPPKAPAPVSST
ncbi:MAG: hypothetical protein DWQ36_05870 [Acidobacteria bacterium]|nr:MAG: hypothetical protein DWQ30_08650 [Acidobacteriota bacterium]REK09785.1 MAG: hypothetical protein DWQ36_05870 [Acidobacteriota bacterium]